MRANQIYKYEIHFENQQGALFKILSPGKFARPQRIRQKIQTVTEKLEAKGCRVIWWGIWNTKTNNIINYCNFPVDNSQYGPYNGIDHV